MKGMRNLQTERLQLRKFIEGDEVQLFKNCDSDQKAAKYLPFEAGLTESVTRERIQNWIAGYQKGNYMWAVEVKDTGELIGFIGTCSLYQDLQIAEIAYKMGSRFWNKGYMSEALKVVLQFLLLEERFYLVEAKYNSSNIGSGRVMEKSGMTLDAALRGRRIDPETKDRAELLIYSITQEEMKCK